MRNFAIASLGLAISSVALAQEPSSLESIASKAALQQFQRDQGSDWVIKWHPATGTPSTIYGSGIRLDDWRENTLAEGRRHAHLVLEQYREMLGLGTSDFTESIGARMGRTWSFKFDQSFRGLPVIDGRADVRINMSGVVAMFGSKALPIPADFDVRPTIGAELATAAAWDDLGETPTGAPQPGVTRAPRLVIWADSSAQQLAPIHLAWEVSISNVDATGAGSIGRCYVDAANGAVLHFVSDKHECGTPGCKGGEATSTPAIEALTAAPVPTTVTLMGWTRTGNDALSALVNVPLPGVQVSVPGVGTVVTDQNGEFTIDINSSVNVSIGNLDGRHHQLISGPDAPTASVTVNPGVPTTIQLSSAGASTNEGAHTTTSWWVDKTNEFCRSILGNSAQLATASNVGVTVNIASTCNAYYTGNTINFYSAGGGCSNTAFSTVVAHEWGHGLDDRYGGIANSNAEGLSEGWGDIIGLYLVDNPILGSGFQTAGVGIRNGNNTRVWPYSSASAPHPAGEVWMGFAWRFRDNLRAVFGTPLAQQISNDIVIGSIVADATTREGAVLEVFLADDDDGNLLNGTPHYQWLSAAAITKGIPYPEVQVVSVAHTPLANTNQRLVPREVLANITPISGSITGQRIVFNTGGANTTRNMHPTGAGDQFVAMLPGLTIGSVNYHIEVDHSSGITVRLPESGEFTYSMIGGNYSAIFSDGFETGAAGWTHGSYNGTDDWQLGPPAGKSGTQSGVLWADPASAAAGSNVYGNDIGQGVYNGRYPANVDTWLRSPTVNCSGRNGVRLRFRRWLSVEEAQFDQARIYVNGQQVWQNPVSGHTQDNAWQQIDLPIPMADNNPAVQIEWRLTSDGGLHMGGWHLDEVEIVETIVQSVDCDLTFLPEQAVQGATLTMTITTPGNSRPFLVALGDTIGPIVVPGLPILFIGGNVTVASGTTDASGVASFPVTAPTVPTAIGLRMYTQVLTFDQAFTQFVASNRHVNLFTQTP